MELDYSKSFADQYGIEADDYRDVDVTSIPFSVRIANRLKTNHIATISDLLLHTPEQLLQIKGFGKGCLNEIDALFSDQARLRHAYSSCPISVSHSFSAAVVRHREEIMQGIFHYSDTDLLDGAGNTEIIAIQEAYEALGPELIEEISCNPEYVHEIIHMFSQFIMETDRILEISFLLHEIPEYRRQNLARGYINAYTQNEEARATLSSQFGNGEMCLGEFQCINLLDDASFALYKRFLKWCSFDLSKDISALLTSVTSGRNLQTIIERRARKCTLEQVGTELHVTRERVRQLEAKALRVFAHLQGQARIISKISAEKNGDAVITPADVERYSGEHSVELLFLLRHYEGGPYTYDRQLDVFIVGDDTLHDRIYAYVDALPDMFSVRKFQDYVTTACEEQDLSAAMLETAIAETFRLTGDIYHRSKLSLGSIYTEILKSFYPNGIRAYDTDEIKTFRQHVISVYGDVKMPQNDRALTARIAGICVLCGRGVYRLKQKKYISDKLSTRIYDYIINSENSIFLMNTLFSVFEDDLRTEGVDNKYYLQGILHELYGDKLVFTRDYVSKDGGETSIYSSVVAFIQQSRYPISKKQILEQFPGLPDAVIAFSVNNANVLNYFGEYLHTSKLLISPEDERYLDKVIRSVLKDGTAHHIKDFYNIISQEKPEIFTRNAALYPFSAYSILEYLFRDSYQFSRPYIAAQGVEIGRPAERLHDYLYSADEFSFDDISDFSKDNHFAIPSQLDYVNSCNDRFLIANNSTVKTIESIGITETIASAVDAIIAKEVSGTVPIRQLTCWSQFPQINVPWTEWLVYSVLNKWSSTLSVAPSSNQFRSSIPLVAPNGMMDTVSFASSSQEFDPLDVTHQITADNLNNIDDILADMLGDELLEESLWD